VFLVAKDRCSLLRVNHIRQTNTFNLPLLADILLSSFVIKLFGVWNKRAITLHNICIVTLSSNTLHSRLCSAVILYNLAMPPTDTPGSSSRTVPWNRRTRYTERVLGIQGSHSSRFFRDSPEFMGSKNLCSSVPQKLSWEARYLQVIKIRHFSKCVRTFWLQSGRKCL
jgi:hypothetical protein